MVLKLFSKGKKFGTPVLGFKKFRAGGAILGLMQLCCVDVMRLDGCGVAMLTTQAWRQEILKK